jgi:serine/threonine protein kinase
MIGTKLAHYEITGHLGTGGMGEVYQATDSKLGRSVAIKLLPEAFTHDTERVARFEREARVLASLNHPNIAAIYGVEESGGRKFLVMELVGGETLAERIVRRPIPVEETLNIAKSICEALEAAHERGIIHRDLKPGNVMVRSDGTVKMLDFGLAKITASAEADATSSNSPTMLSSMPYTILGTAAYMSPEQVTGKEADRESDVWAFGCVLYEMLTGRRAFQGGSLSEVLAGILKSEPDWHQLPGGSEGVYRLLRRCLQKDQKSRLRDFRDARIEIDEVQSEAKRGDPVVQSVSHPRERFALISALALVVLFVSVVGIRAFRQERPSPELRLEINTPPTTDPVSLAISPDGHKVVFVANNEGGSQLWLRSLDSVSARPLAGTDGARFPFWSPDNRSIGFFAEGKLKRMDIDAGSVRPLADAVIGQGGTWNADGIIVFAPNPAGGLRRVSANGGESTVITRVGELQVSHRFPQFLPDGRHFLYYRTGVPEARGVYIGQLDASETRRMFDTDFAAVYASTGQLLFVRQGTLFAQNFDPNRLALTGDPYPVAGQVVAASAGLGALSASAAGPVVYRTGSAVAQRQFMWFDRTGKEIEKVGGPDSAAPSDPSLSPDGRRVALHRTVNGNTDIWLLELGRNVLSRLTFDPAVELRPTWSPDGRRIVFQSNRLPRTGTGLFDLYQKTVFGTGSEERFLTTPQSETVTDWSRDGRFVLYRTDAGGELKTGFDIWAFQADGDQKPFPVLRTNFEERDGQFSPDGKWIAYQSNESGRVEIYVQPFSGREDKVSGKGQISTNGGAQVRWRPDGKELFYIALDGRLMAVSIRIAPDSQSIDAGPPVALFPTRVGGAVQGISRQQYMVSPDGRQFLMNNVMEEVASPIAVILNWKPKL